MTEVKRITEIWTAMQVEPNGQEQIVLFNNGPLIVADPAKVPMLQQLAEMMAFRADVQIVKFSVREDLQTITRADAEEAILKARPVAYEA